MEKENDSVEIITDYLINEFGMAKEDVSEIFDIFFEETQISIEELNNCISETDFEKIVAAAHAIKGSAANINAVHISEYALQIEQAAKNSDIAPCQEYFPILKVAFETLHKEYESGI